MVSGIRMAGEGTIFPRKIQVILSIIFLYLLVCPSSGTPNGTETLITTDTAGSAQVNPAVSGSFIVWEDWRPMNPNVYVYNPASGDEFPAARDDNLMQTMPAISGPTLVWQQFDTSSYTYSLQVFNLTSHDLTSIAANHGPDPQYTPEDNCFPKVSGNVFVWQDFNGGDWDIYLHNVTTAVSVPVVAASADQKNPAIYGNFIAYENWSDPVLPEIWLHDIANGSSVPVIAGSYAVHPALSRDFLVWQEKSGPMFRIFSYDMHSGTIRQVTPALLSSPQRNPSLDEYRVVVQDYRRSGSSDLYLYDLRTGEEVWVSPQPAGSEQITPAISGDTIVWDDSRSGTSDIYLFTLGSPDSCPVADFSPSVHAGAGPLTVNFTDNSRGSPILYRTWNYSDSTTSYPLDPAGQIFPGPGIYHTRLTVGNTKCRNVTTAAAKYDIYIDTPPDADFIATPLDGFAPLLVRFTDISGGDPASWTWDFGDGSVSHEQNPLHTFATDGQTYTVTLTVNNTFAAMAPDSETKAEYVRTFLGATGVATTPVEGITMISRYGGWFLVYNATMLPDIAAPDQTILTAFYPGSSGWQNITFIAGDAAGFADTYGNSTYMGNLSRVFLQTEDVTASGTSPAIGTGWGVSYRVNISRYPSPASISTRIWENATAADQEKFRLVAIGSNFLPNNSAYTAVLTKTGFGGNGNATINMSLDRAWLGGQEVNTYIIGYGVNSDGNTVGSVTPARYLFNDGTLDYFEAEVPEYFTTFGIAPLSGSGNPFQLITLSVTSHVSPPAPDNPYEGTDSGMPEGGGAAAVPVVISTAAQTPAATQVPADPGRSAKVYTNANGVVTQATRLQSSDGRATVLLGEGVVVKDATGNPPAEISIKGLPAESLPLVPSGSTLTFAGMAYDIGPEGATFSPSLTLTFTLPQARWGQDYSVKLFDTASGAWVDLPTNFDTAAGTVTVQVPHLCCIALFTEPRAAPAATPSSPLPLPAAPQAKAQPPTTAVNIFVNMMGWAADLLVNNILVLVMIIGIVVAIVIEWGRFPGFGR